MAGSGAFRLPGDRFLPALRPSRLPVYGLVPAAGRALRLGPLPCSKELLPIGFRSTPSGPAPKVAGHYLLESFRRAGIDRVFFVLHESKMDVPRYFGTGALAGVSLAYLSLPGSASIAETLDHAYPFVAEGVVALGFPDALFTPADAYRPLLSRLEESGADLVLGCFPARNPRTTDMVDLDPGGRVLGLEIRPFETRLAYNWLIAVWGPAFTRHLRAFVGTEAAAGAAGETPIGAVVQAAIEEGLRVEGVPFPEGSYRDVGTPSELAAAIREHAHLEPPSGTEPAGGL